MQGCGGAGLTQCGVVWWVSCHAVRRQPAIIGRSLVHIPAATHRHQRQLRSYTYTKHKNFTLHSDTNTLTSRTQHWGYTKLTGTNSSFGTLLVFTGRRGRTWWNAGISLLILLSSAPVTCLEGRPKWSSASCGR